MTAGDYAGGRRGRAKNKLRCLLQLGFATLVVLLLFLYYIYMSPDVKPDDVCETEMSIHHDLEEQHKMKNTSHDEVTVRLKRQLYADVLAFQRRSFGAETLPELLRMRSRWSSTTVPRPRVTVILNHFKRRTLCAQLEQLRRQTLPFHRVWVLSFGSPNEARLRRIVDQHNDSRISFVSSGYDFKYYGRFQMALQSDAADYVYVLDDDMIPGARMLEILCHVAGTDKYSNAVLGSIGRILPFRRKDLTFPSYRTLFRSREAGLYLPYHAYGIAVDRIVQVDFLCSSWFLPAGMVKTLFIEAPLTFMTGEDLHLSYQLQKYMGAASFVLPVDAADKATWGDNDHRLAYVSPTTSTSKDMVRLRDEQWWRALTSGYVTQWAAMHPQKVDAVLYAHTLDEVRALAPLLHKFRASATTAYLVVSGERCSCSCEDAAAVLKWPKAVCKERRFSILDLGVDAPVLLQAVYAGMRGIVRTHNPRVVVALAEVDGKVKEALRMAAGNRTSLVLLPRRSVSKVLWMATLQPASLQGWNRMRISVNIMVTQTGRSLQRLLTSLQDAYYVGDEVSVTFNMDAGVDATTLKLVTSFQWPHGSKTVRLRSRIIHESWYPSSDHDYGLFLTDDAEVSPYYYLWVKYALLTYRYPAAVVAELASICLVELATKAKSLRPNSPYLHQLPCTDGGAVFFPSHWREFYAYMSSSANVRQESWKMFLVDIMHKRGYVTLYPNFPSQTSFATNHMEPGVKDDDDDFIQPVAHEGPLVAHDFTPLLPTQKSLYRSVFIKIFAERAEHSSSSLETTRLRLSWLHANCYFIAITPCPHSSYNDRKKTNTPSSKAKQTNEKMLSL